MPRDQESSINKLPLVSIIIPVREINDYIREAIPYHLAQTYQNFELLIFPDEEPPGNIIKTEAILNKEDEIELKSQKIITQTGELWVSWAPKHRQTISEGGSVGGSSAPPCEIRIIPTGKMGPAKKRDLALIHAKGSILAFIDDDAYPEPDWLQKAIVHFQDPTVGGVGGPAVTPLDEPFWQRVSGEIYESRFMSAHTSIRYKRGQMRKSVEDWPTVNLFIRTETFQQCGGFDSAFYPGEDTKLCHDIVHNLNQTIVYEPEALVWHHRRPFGKKHFIQLYNYALHRGYFMKHWPKTSLKTLYFIPTLFCSYLLILAAISTFISPNHPADLILMAPLVLYGTILVTELMKNRNPLISLILIPGIFLSHLTYGIGILIGLFSPSLKEDRQHKSIKTTPAPAIKIETKTNQLKIDH